MKLTVKIHIVAVAEDKSVIWEERQEDTIEEAEKRFNRIMRVGGEVAWTHGNKKAVQIVMFDGETGDPLYVTVYFKAVWG